ncbi:nonribosomal peptide synthetase MxaA [Methyloceanibacter sp. wino2]|uniref:nonribosomal peptide synthetase MxaA n=1 Tax=Methyloceanibacter sp. wino2 TaxID=2170729 RepID=UPI000D3ECB08|nr:nonribosomal peptide synthetase MxaA [Methyloceanibacter sp. wino2]
MIAFVLALLLSTPALAADEPASPVLSVSTVEPRGFGYFVGDLLTREVHVDVAKPYVLEAASQPKPGRLAYWLDLRSVDLTEREETGATRYRLKLVYQTLYVPLSPAERYLPAFELRFKDGDDVAVAKVPPFKFVMAPLREVIPEVPAEGPEGYLRPDAKPQAVSTRRDRILFGIGLGLAGLALIFLAYDRAWWPFRARPDRPFARASRRLRFLARLNDDEAYREGLLDLHRAFDASAGRRVLAEDVGGFLESHAVFRAQEREIDRFFAASRQAFFANDVSGAEKSMPLPAMAALGAELSAAERRAS